MESSLNIKSRTARDLRCPRLCEGFWLYPVSTFSADSKRHVTPISASHFSMSFETVPNAPINYYALPISRSVSSPLQVFVVFNFLFLFVFHPGVKWTLSLSLSLSSLLLLLLLLFSRIYENRTSWLF